MKSLQLLAFFVFCAFSSLKVAEIVFPVPQGWQAPVYDFEKNPLNAEKVELGRTLFYDPILSRDNTISCASCHSPYNGFAHVDHALSHGIEDRIGTRNAPALFNLAWHKSFMWDGAIHHLDMQALAPISHPKEMDANIAEVLEKLRAQPLYQKLFFQAYKDSLMSGERILKALSQFQLTLISAESKYDSVMRKQSTFTVKEQNGYQLFQKHCNSCHREPLFSTFEFANNGLSIDTALRDWGRMKQTQNSEDSLKFKIPSLRNVAYTFPYMHDGRFKKLSAVLNHYSQGIVKSKTLAPELQENIALSADEKVEIIAFLQTLSDKKFIFNPKHQYPKEIFSAETKE